ncbi:MAG: hypothetical protein JWM95_2746 [Gemmatimonadetes bacterium]|nr:hypothetical protein [Gemmatimonadota bacterium]
MTHCVAEDFLSDSYNLHALHLEGVHFPFYYLSLSTRHRAGTRHTRLRCHRTTPPLPRWSVAIISESHSVVSRVTMLLASTGGSCTKLSPRRSQRQEPSIARYDIVCLDRSVVVQMERELMEWRRI